MNIQAINNQASFKALIIICQKKRKMSDKIWEPLKNFKKLKGNFSFILSDILNEPDKNYQTKR